MPVPENNAMNDEVLSADSHFGYFALVNRELDPSFWEWRAEDPNLLF